MNNYFHFMQPLPTGEVVYFILVLLVFFLGAFFLFTMKLLTRRGSIITGIIGIYLAGVLGVNWIIPVLYFFITSVFFTRLKKFLTRERKESAPRNMWQVLANILPAVVISVFYLITTQEIFILLFISLVAAVSGDTWASEIGPIFNKKCLSLKNLKSAKAGTSGGISLAGSLAAFVGSGTVAVLSYSLFLKSEDVKIILFLSLSGFLATFVDSLLGAFWEPALMKNNYFRNKKHPKNENISPNDLVNIFGSISAPVFFLLMLQIY